MFRLIPSEYLVGMCDVVPPYVQQESIMAYFDKLGDKMYHIHLIDMMDQVIPYSGEGQMPLKELVTELKEMNYDKQ